MSEVILSYDDVELKIARINRVDTRAVYTDDGVDYLYTHLTLHATCVWNEDATSTAAKVDPAAALAQLRHRLLQPRKKLRLSLGADYILYSPPQIIVPGNVIPGNNPPPGMSNPVLLGLQDAPCDANNGPNPISCTPVEFQGWITAVVDYQIETWLVECSPIARALLAHRWEMSVDIDEDYYTTRTITGTCVFRADVLALTGWRPDDFREVIRHPIPDTFQRGPIRVTPSSDGTTLRYTVVDSEMTLNLNRERTITRIKGRWHVRANWKQWVPVLQLSLVVEVWGERRCSREDLYHACTNALASWGMWPRLAINDLTIIPPMSGMDFELDTVDKYASFMIDITVGGTVSGMAAGLLGLVNFDPPEAGIYPEGMPPVASASDGPGIAPPVLNQDKGTYLAQLLAQSLSSSCRPPAAPPAQLIVSQRKTP